MRVHVGMDDESEQLLIIRVHVNIYKKKSLLYVSVLAVAIKKRRSQRGIK